MKRIVFCGFGRLGKECMRALVELGHQIQFVLTHNEEEEASVDTFARDLGIEYSYVDSRKSIELITKKVRSAKPELLVSVNYRYIIPKEIFGLAKFAINIHGSLLPKYRGRTPHVWSIINGEKESGITCHLIEETVDTGDIISQIKIPIEDDDTGYSLLNKFESNYPKLLINSIDRLEKGTKFVKQAEECASYYGKRTPDMGYIDFRKSGSEVINFIRAQAEPYPGAYYYLLDGRKIIINKISISELKHLDIPIGVIREVEENYIVRCKDCVLQIKDYRIIV